MKRIFTFLSVVFYTSAVYAGANFVPTSDGDGSLGTSSKKWASIYVTSVVATTLSGDGSGITGISAGGGSGSTLGVFNNKVQVTSPTVQINFVFTGTGPSVVANGSTATVTIPDYANSTNTFRQPNVFLSSTSFSTATISMLFGSTIVLNGSIWLSTPPTTGDTGIFWGGYNVEDVTKRTGLKPSYIGADEQLIFYAENVAAATIGNGTQGAYIKSAGDIQVTASIDSIGGLHPRYTENTSATGMGIPNVTSVWLIAASKLVYEGRVASTTIYTPLFVTSMTNYGTYMSTSDLRVHTASAAFFFGDGSNITGISASASQQLPLIEGATNYSGYRSTFTYQQPQTFKSSTTMNVLFVDSITAFGIYSSTSDLIVHTASAAYFFGNGAGITGISASASQQLPLIEGATNYSGYRSTFTYYQPQTFVATVTFIGPQFASSGTFTGIVTSTPGFNGQIFNSTISLGIPIANPSAGTYLFKKALFGMNLTRLACIVDPADSGENTVLNLQECNSDGDSCANTLASDITCANTNTEGVGFSDSSIATGNWIAMKITSVSGTVSQAIVTLGYKETVP